MKKNIIKLGLISLTLIGGIYFYSTNSNKENLNDLAFENIEAIAAGEAGGNFKCYGYGDIDCHGYRVERMYTGLRLD